LMGKKASGDVVTVTQASLGSAELRGEDRMKKENVLSFSNICENTRAKGAQEGGGAYIANLV